MKRQTTFVGFALLVRGDGNRPQNVPSSSTHIIAAAVAAGGTAASAQLRSKPHPLSVLLRASRLLQGPGLAADATIPPGRLPEHSKLGCSRAAYAQTGAEVRAEAGEHRVLR